MEDAYSNVRECMAAKQEHQKETYDQKVHGKLYEVGDLVWLHSSVVPCGQSKKLHHPWTGPYQVVKRLSDITYHIKNLKTKRQRQVVHFNRLKPYLAAAEQQSAAESSPPAFEWFPSTSVP